MTIRQFKKVKGLLGCYGKFRVSENFEKLNTTYELEKVDIWMEHGVVGFTDKNDVIESSEIGAIQGFLFTSAECVINKSDIIFKFKDGKIVIECL